MPNNSQDERAPLSEWASESLRATAFPAADAAVNPENWWRSTVGEEPETQVNRPRSGELLQEGLFHGAKIRFKLRLGRIDWILSPVQSESELPQGFLVVGPFEEACARFRDLISRWFSLSPPLERLAFGAIAILPVPDQAHGYMRLSGYLPSVQLEPEGSSDFSYQINRPRLSRCGISGLSINRLSKWTVARTELQSLTLGPREGLRVIGRAERAFACRVELDMNTSPEFEGVLSPDHSVRVFDELIQLGREILQDGDRP